MTHGNLCPYRVWFGGQDDPYLQAERLCPVADGREIARHRPVGGLLYKKRVARPGSGKSGGYRTLLAARIGSRYVFLHGFPKSATANITREEKRALQFAGKVFLELPVGNLSKALQSGVLLEVRCEQDR